MLAGENTDKKIASFDIITVVFPLILIIIILLVIKSLPFEILTVLFEDDSFFYLKTAYNISAGMGSTFDGINPTNGYHPLYMILLTAVSYIFPIIGQKGLYVVCIVDTLLMVWLLVTVDMILIRFTDFSRWSRILVMTLLAALLGLFDFGLEVKILLPLSWLFIYCVLQLKPIPRPSQLILIGILSALVFLARLDSFLFIGFMFLFILFSLDPSSLQKNVQGRLRALFLLLLPLCIVVLLYAFYNWIVFSMITSISSYLTFGLKDDLIYRLRSYLFPFDNIYGTEIRFIFCFYLSLIYIIVYMAVRDSFLIPRTRFNRLLALLCLFNNLYLVIIVCFGTVRTWYLAFPISISCVTFGCLCEILFSFLSKKFGSLGRDVIRGFVVGLCICGIFFFKGVRLLEAIQSNSYANNIAMGLWVKENLPKDARIYQVDGCGRVAYFSERSIINGDGVINSWEYLKYLQNNALLDYLKKVKAEYVIYNRYRDEENIAIPINTGGRAPSMILTFIKQPEHIVRFGRFVLLKLDYSYLYTQNN